MQGTDAALTALQVSVMYLGIMSVCQKAQNAALCLAPELGGKLQVAWGALGFPLARLPGPAGGKQGCQLH